MSNKENNAVIIELDRPRELRLTHKAMRRFTALADCTMTGMQAAIDDYDKLCTLLYVMLSEDDPQLTIERMDELIADAERRSKNRLRLKDIISLAAAALGDAFGADDTGDETAATEADANPPTAAGTAGQA